MNVTLFTAVVGAPLMPPDVHAAWVRQRPSDHVEREKRYVNITSTLNFQFAHLHGYTVYKNRTATLPYAASQRIMCDARQGIKQQLQCYQSLNRNNCTWFKLRALFEFLQAHASVAYALFLDSDAYVLPSRQHNAVAEMRDTLEIKKKDIYYCDEDWRADGYRDGNTGVMLVKNTRWALAWFKELLGKQGNGCGSNEQACWNALLGRNTLNASDHIYWGSGLRYNCHPKFRTNNTRIVHYMGASKPGLFAVER